MGGCQNYGPFLGTLNIRDRFIIGTQKRTIILTTTHIYIYTYIFSQPNTNPRFLRWGPVQAQEAAGGQAVQASLFVALEGLWGKVRDYISTPPGFKDLIRTI